MRRTLAAVLAFALALVLPGLAGAHEMLLDHPAPELGTAAPASTTVNSGGEGATWELITSVPTGNPHSDIELFTIGGATYVSAGTLGAGPNGGGQTIVQLTNEQGELDVGYVSTHPSASCVSDPAASLGLQHDAESAPKGDIFLNTMNPHADRSQTEVVVDATDANGRCHDQGALGVQDVPQGGLEIIDVTDPANPAEIGLTTHIGESHTVNIDPKRPHIAYSVTSDFVSVGPDDGAPDDNGEPTREVDCDGDGDTAERIRLNECEDGEPLNLDGFEVVDMSSCMYFPDGLTTEQKRERCRPEVYRYRYPTIEMAVGHTDKDSVTGCHELEIYPDDKLTCGSGSAMIMLDMSRAFDDNGTPADFTDDRPRGEPLPCRVRPSSSQAGFATGAMIADCVVGADEADLTVPGWTDLGAPSLEGVRHLGSAHHIGDFSTVIAPTQDISFDHEAELTASRDFVIASDERGGGVTPPGAACDAGDAGSGHGGLHAYAVDRLDHTVPPTPVADDGSVDPDAEAYDTYARTPDGDKAIFRATVRTGVEPTLCTVHLFQQIPGQNRIFMGYYTQGTRVADFVEHPDGTFEFIEAGYFVPDNANTWASRIFKVERNDDGTFTYYGATGDFDFGGQGRSAIDVYKVTLPPPPQVASTPGYGPRGACDASVVPDGGFDDVATGVHADNIACLAWYATTRGVDADSFAPLASTTRGEMAALIARMLTEAGVAVDRDAPDAFDDDGGSVFEADINALAALDVVTGTDDRTFRPGANVSRGEMAAFIAGAHEVASGSAPTTAAPDAFRGDGGVFHADINTLAALGVTSGTGNNRFDPARHVTRGETATFVARELELLANAGHVLEGGAEPVIEGIRTVVDGELTGTISTHGSVASATASGCGIDTTSIGSGDFSLTIAKREPGRCELTVTTVVERPGQDQTSTRSFEIMVDEVVATG